MIDPTPEQIEAAAIAFTCETREEWERSPETYKQMIREDARDALVAAAGAAPQKPTETKTSQDFVSAAVQVDEAKLAEVERAAAEKALLDVARMWEETAEQFGTDPEDFKIAKSSANCLRNLAAQYRRNEGEN